jgi:hypothetical protein
MVAKINGFAGELASADTPADERREAFEFLLHFVGDLRQPLRASDDHDAGANQKRVSSKGFTACNLHHFWDTELVQKLGTDPAQVAQTLTGNITDDQVQQWSQGTPTDSAMESFSVAKDHAYGLLPSAAKGSYCLPASYVNDATAVVAIQLSKARVPLATVLNNALR